jgi:hypothetical protein
MNKSKTESKGKKKIMFEKLTVEEEKKVRGSGGDASPPNIYDC